MSSRSTILLLFVFILVVCCGARDYQEYELEKKDFSYYLSRGFFGASIGSMLMGGSSGLGVGTLYPAGLESAFVSLLGPSRWDTGFIKRGNDLSIYTIVEDFWLLEFAPAYFGPGFGVSAGTVAGSFNPELLFSFVVGSRFWRCDGFIRFLFRVGFQGIKFEGQFGTTFIVLGGVVPFGTTY